LGYGTHLSKRDSPVLIYVSQIEDKFSPYAKETLAKLIAFLQVSVLLFSAFPVIKSNFKDEILPSVKLVHAQLPTDPAQRWTTIIPIIEELKVKAKKLGLWNLFLSKAHYPEHGVPLSNLEVRVFLMLRSPFLMAVPSMLSWQRSLGGVGTSRPRLSIAPHLILGTWVSRVGPADIALV
jgi:hypothetical protein